MDKRIFLPLLLAPVLSACVVQSQVQGRYIDAQDNCRDQAESTVSKLPNASQMTPQQQSAEVVNQFSICMNQSGWHVANPLKPKDRTTTTDAGIQPVERATGARAVPGATPAAGAQARPATTAAPAASAAPSDIAPPARYDRTLSPSEVPQTEDRIGRRF